MGKSLVALIVLSLILLAGQLDRLPVVNQPGSPATGSGQKTDVPVVDAPVCRGRDPKEHVYHPQRLTLIAQCSQVTGTIKSVRFEEDGDYHILLELDPQFSGLVNDGNKKLQQGWLVMEPVCMTAPKEQAAQEACGDYMNPLTLPEVGQHVVAIGPYVLDTEHSNWAEIHPLWQISPI